MSKISQEFAVYVHDLVVRGGPLESEYGEFTRRVREFDKAKRDGLVAKEDEQAVLDAFGDAVSVDTIQGFTAQRPHGYWGDYEVIDRIYTEWVSPHKELASWDRYFHAQAAPRAVRNRKAYFHSLLDRLSELKRNAYVLNLGSGPGRCMLEWLEANTATDVRFDCVDIDSEAIEYARFLNARHIDRITFRRRNVLRFRPEREYELIWAAGLFDYFEDRVFVAVVRRMLQALAPSGELVIGNFGAGNPTQAYMELGGWKLIHRTEDEMRGLMLASGADPQSLQVHAEPEGVNLFAHAACPTNNKNAKTGSNLAITHPAQPGSPPDAAR